MYGNTLKVTEGIVENPQGEVSREYEVMHKNLESLRVVINDLESRLVSVLAERKEPQEAETSQPQPVRVPLAQSLYNSNSMLVEQDLRLRSILNRIEL